MATTKKQTEQEKEKAITRLSEMLKPGDHLWFVLRKVGKTGTPRYVDVYLFQFSEQYGVTKLWLTYSVAKALGRRFHDTQTGKLSDATIVAGGGGYDIAHELATDLSRLLFGDPNQLHYNWV